MRYFMSVLKLIGSFILVIVGTALADAAEPKNSDAECTPPASRQRVLGHYADPSTYMHQVLRDVQTALNYTAAPVALVSSNDFDIAAAINNVKGLGPTIAYNPTFFASLSQKSRWAVVGIIAHELGHLIGKEGQHCSVVRRELAADEVSGCALAWMNSTKQQATSSVTVALYSEKNVRYEIPKDKRVEAILHGYSTCWELKSKSTKRGSEDYAK